MRTLLLGILVAGCGATASKRAALGPPMAEGAVEYVVIERGFLADRGGPGAGEMRATVDGEEAPLPLRHTDVKAEIALNVAAVRVLQQFENPYAVKIEAVYVFPLPQDAAVTDFVMTIGERRIRGIIREREEARRIYEEAKRRGHVASLLAQERPNIFEQSVANIEPGRRIDVEIAYFHTLAPEEGVYEFVFPMVVGPRYTPAGQAPPRQPRYLTPGTKAAPLVSLSVALDAGVPLRDLRCTSHAVSVERRGESAATVALRDRDAVANRDFVLRWATAAERAQGAIAVRRGEDGGGYFTMVIEPPRELAERRAGPREMIFVVDCSGSMEGEPIAACQRAMRRCLDRLGPDDRFQIIRFSQRASSMGGELVAATPSNLREGRHYIDALRADGGTEMLRGVQAALRFRGEGGRRRIISFMTDGYIGNEAEILREIHENLGDARIFSFGVGSSVNRYLLERMATAGRGVAAYVGLGDDGGAAVDALYRRIESPAMGDLSIDWGPMRVSDLHPDPLPDLFVGKPVVVTGRFEGHGRRTVKVRGRGGAEALEVSVAVDLDGAAEGHTALPRLWARAKIRSLYDRMAFGSGSREELADSIRAVALRYGLASAFTSFVAVDSMSATAGDHGVTVEVPAPMPEGTRYETSTPPSPR